MRKKHPRLASCLPSKYAKCDIKNNKGKESESQAETGPWKEGERATRKEKGKQMLAMAGTILQKLRMLPQFSPRKRTSLGRPSKMACSVSDPALTIIFLKIRFIFFSLMCRILFLFEVTLLVHKET